MGVFVNLMLVFINKKDTEIIKMDYVALLQPIITITLTKMEKNNSKS